MEKMWLRLPRLFFLYRSRSYLALPVMLSRSRGSFPPEHLPPGPDPCNAPYAPVSSHLFLCHSRTVSSPFAFHGVLK